MKEKQITLYKYVPLKYVTSILDNSRLYLNDGKTFNDPFELSVVDRKLGKLRYIEGLHILSLTNSPHKKLMWSHYAESHRGVCLTVEVPSRLVYPMCYSSQRVYENSDINKIIEKSTIKRKKNAQKNFALLPNKKKYAYVKDKKWIYELEYRIVFDENDESSLIFEDDKWYMPVKVKNIYLGVNFQQNELKCKTEILDACVRNGIKITQMALAESNYSIIPKKATKNYGYFEELSENNELLDKSKIGYTA